MQEKGNDAWDMEFKVPKEVIDDLEFIKTAFRQCKRGLSEAVQNVTLG